MTVYNTINKIKRRNISQLQGLKMNTMKSSFRTYEASVDMLNECVDTSNSNTFEVIQRRMYKELDGLLISIVEKSNRKNNTTLSNVRLVSPSKSYSNNLKITFRHELKTKY